MKELYGDQFEVLQINKEELPEVKKKYFINSYPTFMYITPFQNARTATKYEEDKSYEDLLDWMRLKLRTHDAKLLPG